MAIEITVPRLGWSMEEGLFAGWLKQPGDFVSAGEPLFAVESDKITMDVESLDSGVLFVPPDAPVAGGVVVVGQMLGFLLAPGESEPISGTSEPSRDSMERSLLNSQTLPEPAPPAVAAPEQWSPNAPLNSQAPITPRARRVAVELGIDPTTLTGTGRGGRVREADVRAAQPLSSSPATSVPISGPRRTIAARMLESQQQTAPVTLTSRVDATALVALREQWKKSTAVAPAYTDFVAKLVASALQQHPLLAGRWEADRIVLPQRFDLGLAVDTPQGLFNPVLRDVASATLADLARQSRQLIEAAQTRRLRPEQMTGSVFSISNLGSFGIDAFTPIINYPETAVLGLGAIRKELVVTDAGDFSVRQLMTLSLTFDHRVVDGAPAARFLATLVRLMADPPAELSAP